MLISRSNLAVAAVASRDPKDPALNRVHMDADGSTVAANGSAVMAVGPVDEGRCGFPDVDAPHASPPLGGVGLPLAAAAKVGRNMPRSPEQLQHAQMTRCDPQQVKLLTTDGAHTEEVGRPPMRGLFPAWKRIVTDARRGATVGRIAFNGRDMIELLKAMVAAASDPANENAVFMEVGGPDTPLVLRGASNVTGQHAVAVINPLQTGGQWLEEDDWERGIAASPPKKVIRK